MANEQKWIEMRFVIPENESKPLFDIAREMGLRQIDEDWCTSKRVKDDATLDYAPSPHPPDRKTDW